MDGSVIVLVILVVVLALLIWGAWRKPKSKDAPYAMTRGSDLLNQVAEQYQEVKPSRRKLSMFEFELPLSQSELLLISLCLKYTQRSIPPKDEVTFASFIEQVDSEIRAEGFPLDTHIKLNNSTHGALSHALNLTMIDATFAKGDRDLMDRHIGGDVYLSTLAEAIPTMRETMRRLNMHHRLTLLANVVDELRKE